MYSPLHLFAFNQQTYEVKTRYLKVDINFKTNTYKQKVINGKTGQKGTHPYIGNKNKKLRGGAGEIFGHF